MVFFKIDYINRVLRIEYNAKNTEVLLRDYTRTATWAIAPTVVT